MNTKALRQKILDLAIHGKLVPPACRQAGKSLENIPAEKEGQWFVYVIECVDGSFYKGFTTDLIKRYKQHCAGIGAEWTKTHKPKQLFYWEIHYSEKSAIEREKYLKSGCGREWFKNEVVDKPENWESATVLLEKIRAEKAEKIKKGLPAGRRGELKADKKDSFIFTKECEFDEDKPGKCSAGTRHKRHYEKFADGTVKDIEDEIPFEVPEGWAWCRLTNVAITELGKTLDAKKNKGESYDYLCALNVKWYTFDFTTLKQIRLEEKEKERYLVRKGDLLICEGGDVGRSAIWESDNPIYYQNALHRVRFYQSINQYFFLYVLNHYKNLGLIDDVSGGVTIKHFTQNSMQKLLFPLPPLAEQERIVSVIKSIFSQIDTLDQNKSDLQTAIKQTKSKILDIAIHGKLVPQDPNDEPAEELLKRIATSDNRPYEKIEEEVPFDIPDSWKWVKLGKICDYGKCINVNSSDLHPDDWILDLEDIEKDTGKIISFHTFEERKSGSTKHRFNKGQVLYSKLRPYLNKVVIAPKDGFCTSEIMPLDFNGLLLPKYAQILLMSTYFLEMVNMVTYGVKMPRLGTNDAKNMQIPLPPLAEQHRIVAKIEELFSQLDQIQNNLI